MKRKFLLKSLDYTKTTSGHHETVIVVIENVVNWKKINVHEKLATLFNFQLLTFNFFTANKKWTRRKNWTNFGINVNWLVLLRKQISDIISFLNNDKLTNLNLIEKLKCWWSWNGNVFKQCLYKTRRRKMCLI